MRVTAHGRKVLIEYPSLECGGRWRLIIITKYHARFREKIDRGQEKCSDNGKVTIRRLSRSQLFFLYANAGTSEVTASAVLNRKQ
jgi:hypothetical protein